MLYNWAADEPGLSEDGYYRDSMGLQNKVVFFYKDVALSLKTLSNNGINLHLVSHKTKYGIGNSSKTNIREIASTRIFDWIYHKDLKKNITSVHFCDSFQEKLNLIINLKPKVIIDDLLKIHTDFIENNSTNNLPLHILFEGSSYTNEVKKKSSNDIIQSFYSWKEITDFLILTL